MTSLYFAYLWVCGSAGVWWLLDRLGWAWLQLQVRADLDLLHVSHDGEAAPGGILFSWQMTDVQEAKPNHVNIVQGFAHIELVRASHVVTSKGKRWGYRPRLLYWGALQGTIAKEGAKSWEQPSNTTGSFPSHVNGGLVEYKIFSSPPPTTPPSSPLLFLLLPPPPCLFPEAYPLLYLEDFTCDLFNTFYLKFLKN